jgi:hypothetical protein
MADHRDNPDRPRSRLLRSLAVLAAVVVTSAAFIGGCSGDDDPPSPEGRETNGPSSAVPAADRPITMKATIGRVIGKLGAQEKAGVKTDVSAVVDDFFEKAYLGEFPRTSFDEAYAAFTSGAREDAARDADLLSNAEIAEQIEQATGTKRRVALDVFAAKGQAQGVTARFTLDFSTTGELERTERVKGYLLMSREDDGWRIFGYDVIRSVTS